MAKFGIPEAEESNKQANECYQTHIPVCADAKRPTDRRRERVKSTRILVGGTIGKTPPSEYGKVWANRKNIDWRRAARKSAGPVLVWNSIFGYRGESLFGQLGWMNLSE